LKHIKVLEEDDDRRQDKGIDALHSLSRLRSDEAFLDRAKEKIEKNEQKIEDVKKKFSNVLAYFGEELLNTQKEAAALSSSSSSSSSSSPAADML